MNDTSVRVLKMLAGVVLCLGVGLLGSMATAPAIPGWYAAIEKPFFTPPSWVFAPVWTVLYILMGVSLATVWTEPSGRERNRAMGVFGVQLVLNGAWSFLFFGLHNPLLAGVEIIALWVAIAATIRYFDRISRPAALLLVPYIAWVTIATALNWGVVILNP